MVHGMWIVLFEVTPKPDRWDAYLGHAAALRPELLRIDGFLDNRRFSSRTRTGTVLSLSCWRDERALIAWRSHGLHHSVQAAGRDEVFSDYRLRVGQTVRDPARASRLTSFIENPASDIPPDGADWDIFDGITVPGATLLLLTWRAKPTTGLDGRTDVAVLRDYGMRERSEAPQTFPPVP